MATEEDEGVDAVVDFDQTGKMLQLTVDCVDADGNPAKHRVALVKDYRPEGGVRLVPHDHTPEELEAALAFAHLGGPIMPCARLLLFQWATEKAAKSDGRS